MIFLRGILLFLFPSWIIRLLNPILKTDIKGKIGFSFIFCRDISIGKHATVGHFNIIACKQISIGDKGHIGHLNIIKGNLILNMEHNADIQNQNKISNLNNQNLSPNKSILYLKHDARIGVGHILDLTESITIGSYTVLAGLGSQIWTHAFYYSQNSSKRIRVDASVEIGNCCYIGSRVIICSGVIIGNSITVGAGCCVSKSLNDVGLYVNQPLRFIHFESDNIIDKFKNPISHFDDFDIYHRNN